MCYQRAGYTIIPVSSRNRASASGSDPRYFIDKARFSKGPLTADHVAVWWTQFPTADIGLVVGPPGDMMVVELKTHSANPAIFEGEWSRTPTIRTRTGVKMLFNFPSNMRLTSDIEISPNMVIRSTNGVTLLPPSRDSRGYKLRWILMPKSLEQALLLINTRYDGETCTVADPPKWLMDRLAPHLCTS